MSALPQVDQAYLQYGPDHNIVAFMQSLGYSEFTAASADEEKMSQFKRALKLTRPAFAATRSPMQQVSSCLETALAQLHLAKPSITNPFRLTYVDMSHRCAA